MLRLRVTNAVDDVDDRLEALPTADAIGHHLRSVFDFVELEVGPGASAGLGLAGRMEEALECQAGGWSINAQIVPMLNGDQTPTKYRIPPVEARQLTEAAGQPVTVRPQRRLRRTLRCR